MKQKTYSIDINCDLGEGEPLARTRALMRLVTSANVACGGHAGDVRSMEACAAMARTFKTKLGAHPGFCDRENLGRKVLPISGDELELLLPSPQVQRYVEIVLDVSVVPAAVTDSAVPAVPE